MKPFFAMAALLFAGVVAAGSIQIEHAYSYPTPAPGVPGVGFLTVTNTGSKADQLLSIESPLVQRIEIHQMRINDGVMQMRAMQGGVAVPAGKSVTFAPGGLHLMLFAPTTPLVVNMRVPVTLHFKYAGTVQAVLIVQPRESEAAIMPADHGAHLH